MFITVLQGKVEDIGLRDSTMWQVVKVSVNEECLMYLEKPPS